MPDHSLRKLAAKVDIQYYDKSSCVKEGVFSFQADAFICDKGQIACCGPSSPHLVCACQADAEPCGAGLLGNRCLVPIHLALGQ